VRNTYVAAMFICFMTACASAKGVAADPATTAAVLQQTFIQTAEHARQLEEAIRNIELLQSQVQNTQQILQLAVKAADGVDGLQVLGDFRNAIVQTDNVINDLKRFGYENGDVTEKWKDLFGSLDPWVTGAKDAFNNIDISDRTSSSGYLVADSYQKLYEQNSGYVQQFMENSKNVSEKGALKQIAQEMAQLIQMENNVIYLLSQILKGQSVEHSNNNLDRKADVIKFEQENEGIRRFMNSGSALQM
jgi:hypothetical protein